MRSILSLLALLTAAVLAAPVEKRQNLISNQWLVKLRDSSDNNALTSAIDSASSLLGVQPRRIYNFGAFKGFAIVADGTLVQSLLTSLTQIESIEQDSRVTTQALVTQTNLPSYGLARISHKDTTSNTYIYDSSAGQGTYSYILDTGINLAHNDFGGRAIFGADFSDESTDGIDRNGHGSHVSGTTGGTSYGVAKLTTLIAVKALNAAGSGATSDILAGLDWAVNDMKSENRVGKSVINISLGGPTSPMTNAAANEAVRQGLFLAVAAGNSGAPSITSSPASAQDVCTVAASDRNNVRASFSNFGALVDIYGPGVNITSAWFDGPNSQKTISGTSMATPHIAGLGAYLLALEGSRTPLALCQRIKDLGRKGAVSQDIITGLTTMSTLAYNGNGA